VSQVRKKSIKKGGGPVGRGLFGGPGEGALWDLGRGPYNTVQMELVYYNDHRVSPQIIF
jgi:hypothetical protein